jgi:hypothetical protein
MRRSLFIAAAFAMLAPTMTLAGTATTAEFVSGTVKSIPANTAGSLDTGSSTELRFRYRKAVFSLPYKNITNTQVTEPVGKHLWKVPVPKVGKSARYLNISYREGNDSRMLTFRAPTGAMKDLVSTIEARRKDPQTIAATEVAPAPVTPPAAAVATSKPPTNASAPAPAPAAASSLKSDSEVWWGDKYWRTTRNKPKWPEVPAETAPGVPAGTKE